MALGSKWITLIEGNQLALQLWCFAYFWMMMGALLLASYWLMVDKRKSTTNIDLKYKREKERESSQFISRMLVEGDTSLRLLLW